MPRLSRRHMLAAMSATLASPALTAGAETPQARTPRSGFGGRATITRGIEATVSRVATSRPLVALTFDDGPHHRLTAQLMDILRARGVRATFYVIGNRVVRHPQLVARLAAEGHEVGNHTWSHPSLHGHSDAGVLNQIDRTSAAIQQACGRVPVTMRPPYGNLHMRQRLMLYQSRGMPTVLWSVDPQDWNRPGSTAVASRILGGIHPGAVVLAHDIQAGTVRAMPSTIDTLIARGYRFVTVSELIGWPRWDRRRPRVSARGGAPT